jgi:FKBP-type peptidyl-prolyl cis-trans isomerase
MTYSLDRFVKGWQEGIPGMKVGGKRRLIVPPELGYGKNGFKGPNGQFVVPPDAMLIFEIELLDVPK